MRKVVLILIIGILLLRRSGPIETLRNKKKETGIGAVFSGRIDGIISKAYVINLRV